MRLGRLIPGKATVVSSSAFEGAVAGTNEAKDMHPLVLADCDDRPWGTACQPSPDLLLLDVSVQRSLSGLRLCRSIRAHPELAGTP
jgi:CheY-like chemotaxis protein